MKLLLVRAYSRFEPDPAMALQILGAELHQVAAPADALELLRISDYDAVVIDAAATQDECYLLKLIRAQGNCTPVLLLSASTSGESRAFALRCGADDLLTKPYHVDELVARIESIIRRLSIRPRPVVRIGPLQIDMASKQAHIGNRLLELTTKEFAIVELLALRAGRVVSGASFDSHMYRGKEVPKSRVLDVCICSLRKKLAAAGGGSLIQTIRFQGYIIRDFVPTSADLIQFFAENGRRTVTTVTQQRMTS